MLLFIMLLVRAEQDLTDSLRREQRTKRVSCRILPRTSKSCKCSELYTASKQLVGHNTLVTPEVGRLGEWMNEGIIHHGGFERGCTSCALRCSAQNKDHTRNT
jgi:hypothetical protein